MVPLQWLVRKRLPSECQHMERRSPASWVGREGGGGEVKTGCWPVVDMPFGQNLICYYILHS